jgi:hypothetical protein
MIETSHQVEEPIRKVVQSGEDIYQQIQGITLKALTEHKLDLDNIKRVFQAAGKGISAGITTQDDSAREAFKQSATALDDALAKAAEASKLAIEEAASRVNEFSREDLNRATEDLKALENLFIETMQNIARDSNQVVVGTAHDFIEHLQKSGTAVGKQTITAMTALQGLPHLSKEALVSSTVASTSALAQIGSGILAGIAESLKTGQEKHNDPR